MVAIEPKKEQMIGNQLSIWDLGKKPFKIDKPVRLIELFSGIGAISKALENLKIPHEIYKSVDFDTYAVQSYNAIHNTSFEPQDITKITGKDLNIVDTDKYCYIMSYSFPCQDLSLAGKGRGMREGSETRSSLLWQVKRLLEECENKPQVLLMENVSQVHGSKNINEFAKWINFLESIGYSTNVWQDLNAKDFGVPQHRLRTFMVSTINNTYTFPTPIPLTKKLKDLLETQVDEKYYLSDKMIQYISANNEKWDGNNNKATIKETLSKHLTETLQKETLEDGSFIDAYNRNIRHDGISGTISTRTDASNDTYVSIAKDGIPIKTNNSTGYIIANEGDGIYTNIGNKRGTVQKGMIPALTQFQDKGVVVLGNYSPSGHNASRVVDKEHIAPTIMENHGTITAITEEDKPKVIGGTGNKCNNNTQYHYQNRVYDNKIATALTSNQTNYIDNQLRIRKLTPKECWRLMGFDDADIEKAQAVGVSNAQLYKQAGNSIVVNVVEAIFKQMI